MAVGVALVGSGIFSREEHLPAIIFHHSLLELKAIYSHSLKSAQALAQSGESATENIDLYSEVGSGADRNYEALLQRTDIQAVIIALPILIQPVYIRSALQAGKHVLAEKPIAKDVETAEELLKWYRSSIDTSKATLSIAENFRYLDSFLYGAEQARSLGRVIGFRTRVYGNVKQGGKYFETPWRKFPEYQGGFLLDGGVHFAAGTRLLLGPENAIDRVSAFTTLLREHLPPVDTVSATLRTKTGIVGTYYNSFGTSFTGNEYAVACEDGTISITRGLVTIVKDGKEEKKEFLHEGSGVKQEVKAWVEGIMAGKQDTRQTPEEALEDLRLIEAMLKSGEQNGSPIDVP